LLIAVQPRAFERLAALFRTRFKRPLDRIGVLRAGEGVAQALSNGEQTVAPGGWDHFS
jgi:hypothetical protein